MEEPLVVIGQVGRPHGIRGELRAHPTGPTLIGLKRGERLVATLDGVERVVVIRAMRPAEGAVIVSLEGVDTRDRAASFVGATLAVPSGNLAPLADPEEFYVRDLVGCAVVTERSGELGQVTEVHQGAANDALEVATSAGTTILVPFTRDAIESLDMSVRRITVRSDLLEGMDT